MDLRVMMRIRVGHKCSRKKSAGNVGKGSVGFSIRRVFAVPITKHGKVMKINKKIILPCAWIPDSVAENQRLGVSTEEF